MGTATLPMNAMSVNRQSYFMYTLFLTNLPLTGLTGEITQARLAGLEGLVGGF